MSRFTRALLLVVACFGVVCTAGPSQTFHLNRIQAVAQQLQQAIQEQAHQIHDYSPLAKLREALRAINQQHANNQRFQAQAAECDSAVSSLNEVAASCSVSDIYEGLSDPNSLCPAAIRLFCRGDCSSRLNASLHQVNKNCSGLSDLQGDFNATSDFRQALVVANVFCQRDEEGRYCTNFFRNVSRLSTSLASGSLSADQLDRMCNSTCIADQFAQLTGFGQGSVLGTMGWARLLCSKIDDKYCALTYQENLLKLQAAKIAEEVQPQPPSNSSSNTTQPQPVQNSTNDNSNPRQIDYSQTNLNSTILDSACDVCFRRFVQGAHQLLTLTPNSTGTANFSAADFESSVDALSYVCNCEANRYCLNRLEANMTLINLTACGDKFDNVNSSISGSCSNNCTDAIKSAIDAFGCCMLTYFQNKTQDSIVKGRNLGFPFIVKFIEDKCDVPMPNSCAKRQVNFSVALSNVKASWINEKDNWEAVQEAFHWDLAARTGMPYDAIVVSSYDIKDFNENDPSTSGTSRIAHINHKKKKDKCGNHTDTPTPTKPPTTPTEPGQGVNVTNDTSSSNSTALIPDGIVINGAVYPPCDKDLAAFLDVQDNGFPDDDLDLVNTASAIPLDARVDPLQPFKFMSEDSSVQLVNNPDGPK